MHVLQKKLCWPQKKYCTFSASISPARHQTFTEGAERRLTHCSLTQAPSSLNKIHAAGNLEKRYNLQKSMKDTDTTSKGCLPLKKKNCYNILYFTQFCFCWLVGGWVVVFKGWEIVIENWSRTQPLTFISLILKSGHEGLLVPLSGTILSVERIQ